MIYNSVNKYWIILTKTEALSLTTTCTILFRILKRYITSFLNLYVSVSVLCPAIHVTTPSRG